MRNRALSGGALSPEARILAAHKILQRLVDVAELDEGRARDWVIVRSVLNAHWAHEDAVRAGRGLDEAEREHVTACIAIAKAVQD